MKLKELLNSVMFNGGYCIRLDIVIRYMGVKGYVETGAPHYIYRKLQYRRRMTLSKPNAYKADPRFDNMRLPRMVGQFQEGGFNADCPVILGRDGKLIEGAHRLACCVYYDIKEVPVVTKDRDGCTDDPTWYLDHFDPMELDEIDMVKGELYEHFKCT